MADFEVTSPDGRKFVVSAPDGATQEQVLSYAQSQFSRLGESRARAEQQVANDSVSTGARNFAAELPMLDKLRAGAWSGMAAPFRGAGQLLRQGIEAVSPTSMSDLVTGQRSTFADTIGLPGQRDIDEQRRLEAPLMKTGAGLLGGIAGGASTALPSLLIPGANTVVGAGLFGAGMSALNPVATGESRLNNALVGGVLGGAGQAVGNVIGRALKPVQSSLTPVEQQLAAAAQARGIPLTAGQATGSRPLQIAESVMENLPFTSGPQSAIRQSQQTAFNRAVGETFGTTADALTPQVMGSARNTIGQRFTDLAGRNTLSVDNALLSSLSQVDDSARRYLTPDVGRVVLNRLDDVLARVENGQMSGVAYRNLDSELGRAMRGTANGDLRNALGDLRTSLRSAMDRSISPADQAAWSEARRQYANLMTVAPVAAKNEAGDVSARTLLAAANTGNRGARFGGPSELAELGRIGRAFVADQIPNSGTAQRQLMQSLLTGGGGAGIGALTSMATGNDPMQGMLLGAGVTGAGLLAPRIAQAAMNSGAGQAYLTRGLLNLSPAEIAALNAAARSLAIGSSPYMTR